MGQSLDVSANRKARKWTARERLGRVLWALAAPFFSFSPRPLWAWRRALLRLFGATVGEQVHIYPSARIVMPWNLSVGSHSAVGDGAILYCLGRITIGERVTVSQYAHLCAGTHDHLRRDFPLVKAAITIEDDAWICADAFVGPGVTIGQSAILAARGVAVRDIAPGMIAGGNPAKPIKPRPPIQ